MSAIENLATLTERLSELLDRIELREGEFKRLQEGEAQRLNGGESTSHWYRFVYPGFHEWTQAGIKRHSVHPWNVNNSTIHHSYDDCTTYPHDIWALKAAAYHHMETHAGCPIWGYSNGHNDGQRCPELAALSAKVPDEWQDVAIG